MFKLTVYVKLKWYFYVVHNLPVFWSVIEFGQLCCCWWWWI